MKLNQCIAIEKGAKTRIYGAITDLHKSAQKVDLYYGFSKTYKPKQEGDETFPPESKKVVLRSDDVLSQVADLHSELIDVTATKDFGNMFAKANVVVDNQTLVKDAPVPYILFLEKQFTDLRTFIDKMPTLDESDDWSKEDATGLFKTGVTETHRTRKVQRGIVLYDATEKHPAQTQLITEDIVVGFWQTVKQSGAITRDRKKELLSRVDAVLKAVKMAREEANVTEIEKIKVGDTLMSFVFA